MSDRVPDDRRAEVLRLRYVDGLSTRAIAAKLSMARRTVRDILGEKRPRPDRPRARAPRESLLAPYEGEIKKRLAEDRDLRAPALLEHLRTLGYRGGISILRERMRELRPDPRPHIEAFSSFTRIRPGQRLEVDWAHFGFLIPGMPREVSVFVALLVYSRMLYVEFVLSRAMGSFLRCMERATQFFGGVTEVDVFDNMKTVVLGRVANKPIFAPRFVEYARARGFAISATFPRRPTGKPFVERAILLRALALAAGPSLLQSSGLPAPPARRGGSR